MCVHMKIVDLGEIAQSLLKSWWLGYYWESAFLQEAEVHFLFFWGDNCGVFYCLLVCLIDQAGSYWSAGV